MFTGCGKTKESPKTGAEPEKPSGSASHEPSAGYTIIEQLMSNTTEMIDLNGRVVHRWRSNNPGGGGTYLLPDGDLLVSHALLKNPFHNSTPGLSGTVERMDWDGNLKWSYTYATEQKSLHHDVCMLPNGHVLMLGVETIPKKRLIELGRDPAAAQKDMWLDFLIEIKPAQGTGGDLVWEWHLADHLIQEFDKTKLNYGVVADHPELLDINAVKNPQVMNVATLRNLQSIGYVGQAAPTNRPDAELPDWTHANSLSYHSKLDQVLISLRSLGEIWIIDHSANTQEAKSHQGGKLAKGGDLIYRWGNPQMYQRGLPGDQVFYGQHNADWVPEGCPGAGDILVFNNGEGRKDGAYSTVEEITPPLGKDGSYQREDGQCYGPAKVTWRYQSEPKTAFHSSFLSGAQRLPNGNTLICSGVEGRMFEVGAGNKIVWEQDRKVASMDQGKTGGPNRSGGPGGSGRPSGFGGQRPGGRRAIAMGVQIFSLSGTGQVAAFGAFDFFTRMNEVAPPPRGPMGPGRADGGPTDGAKLTPNSGGLFRAVRYPPDYAAFKGRKLEPLSESELAQDAK